MAAAFDISDVTRIVVRQDIQEVECQRRLEVPGTFLDALQKFNGMALGDPRGGRDITTYADLCRFTSVGCRLQEQGISQEDVVAICMPNGPELAVVLLCCMTHCVAAPLDPLMSEHDLVESLIQLEVRHFIWLQQDSTNSSTVEIACREVKCNFLPIVPAGTSAGLFSWAWPSQSPSRISPGGQASMDGVALVLRTSGTTSKPKVVPLTRRGLFIGAMCIGHGLGLKANDRCLNVMPLTHIGGISCSLLSTWLTGGLVYCAPIFDPGSFLEMCESLVPQPTWYYAAPTIHKAILLYAKRLAAPTRHCLQLARSGAANLPDGDAKELSELLGCTVLPTYSMSECMPVAQPPQGYNLDRTGSVGVPIASSLRIADDAGTALGYGQDGEVCIRGPVVMRGYKDNNEANDQSFFRDASGGEPWFRTGDVGHLDHEGFLFLTGRCKELIKRGGEQISPYEVEEVLLSHPRVVLAVVFAVPNDFWGEEVAAAVVLQGSGPMAPEYDVEGCMNTVKDCWRGLTNDIFYSRLWNGQPASESDLIDFAAENLADHKVPRQIFFVESADDIPKTGTGKYKRLRLAKEFGLTAVDLVARDALGGGDAEPIPKPHKALYGVRFFFAIWVVYMHMGDLGETAGHCRDMSISMPGFFMLAGFLLSAATSRPIENYREFWRSRILSAHPMYLLAFAVSAPIYWLVCVTRDDGSLMGGTAFAQICSWREWSLTTASKQVWLMLTVVFAQTAWPWGQRASNEYFPDDPVWFSSAYYFSVFCFPFLHTWMKGREFPRCSDTSRSCCASTCFTYNLTSRCPLLVSTTLVVVLTRLMHMFARSWLKYTFGKPGWLDWASWCFPPAWVGMFFLGMLIHDAFVFNQRKARESTWSCWGVLTDAITVLIFACFAVSAFSEEGRKWLWKYVSSNDIDGWQLCLFFMVPWVYGLAVGNGLTCWFLSNSLLVQYLSPASYSIYLFHQPVSWYYYLYAYAWGDDLDAYPDKRDLFNPKEFVGILVMTICVALFVTHIANNYVTSMFMRAFDCGKPSGTGERSSALSSTVGMIKSLTGVDATGSMQLSDCGFDSFGMGSLVAAIRKNFPDARITTLQLYKIKTVAELSEILNTRRSLLASEDEESHSGTPRSVSGSSHGSRGSAL